MRLRLRLHAYLVATHLLFIGVATLLWMRHPLLFVGAELVLVASLALGFHLVGRALEPLAYTQRFHDLLQDQDYAGRLARTEVPELDELVDVFNTMLGMLYRERLEIGEQRGFLDRLLEATPSAVLVFDFDGAVSLVNASALALLELDRPQGKRLADAGRSGARGHDLLAQLDALPLGESRVLTDLDGRRYRGQRGQFFDRGFARHFLMVEELTVELESSERATYEKLVRVLAHEVNNTVGATGSVLDSLLYYRAQLAEGDSADFATAIDAVKRRNASLGEFIERFTRVVRMPEPELRPASIKDIVDDIVWLNREQCKRRGIHIGWTRCDDVAPQPMDSQLIEQALINIVKNALEAIEESARPGGYIHLDLIAGARGPTLSVTDSGNRLGDVPARQLFTPFFTTKKGGQGIGLLFVREVLNRHNFAYRLESTAQGETRFEISFGLQEKVSAAA